MLAAYKEGLVFLAVDLHRSIKSINKASYSAAKESEILHKGSSCSRLQYIATLFIMLKWRLLIS